MSFAGEFQETNAALAVAACDVFLASRPTLAAAPTTPLSPVYLEGLANTRFPGRAQLYVGTGATAEADSASTPLQPLMSRVDDYPVAQAGTAAHYNGHSSTQWVSHSTTSLCFLSLHVCSAAPVTCV